MLTEIARNSGKHAWILRFAYITSLTIIGCICIFFFYGQTEENKQTDSIRLASNNFDLLENELLALSVKSSEIVERHKNPTYSNEIDAALAKLTPFDRRKFLDSLPIDPQIEVSKSEISNALESASTALKTLKQSWGKGGGELNEFVFANARLVTQSNPFKHLNSLLDTTHVSNARSTVDMFWAAHRIMANIDFLIAPANKQTSSKLRELLDYRSSLAGKQLQNFLLSGLGIIGLLAVCVFVPVDINFQRLMKKLHIEQNEVKTARLVAEEARTRAENADRAKSEFLANMSHEIRTPMNGVMGMAELLAKSELNARQRTFTDIIVKSGTSLLTIINDILDFSKIGAGQMELDPAPFRLPEAIEDVATLVSTRVAEKDLELIVRVAPELPEMIVGDVGRIRQIVTNIVGNAVKFTEKGHVFVNVFKVSSHAEGTTDQMPGPIRLRFEVEDTGIGIPEDKVAKVFDQFSQVDSSATRKHEGTGLGLSIASSLVELMNGEIGLRSEIDVGSTFWFEIDLHVSDIVLPKRQKAMDVPDAKILVVDDNAVNRAILSEQMTTWKFDHAAAESGNEALAVIKAACQQNIKIDCVVLDYHMPGFNGGDVVKTMRSDSNMRDVPVIMLTSVDETEDGKPFSSLGIQGHLTKPARSSLLLETIVDVVNENNARIESNDEASVGIRIAQQVAASETNSIPQSTSVSDNKDPSICENLSKNDAMNPNINNGNNSMGKQPNSKGFTDKIEILICEDNEVNQIVFSQILQTSGHSFKIVGNGKLGVRAFQTLEPDLILMDVSMPEMNGLEATQAIRNLEKETGKSTPIIGVTAHALKGDHEKCIEAGMTDYISKPVSPDTLLKKIEIHLGSKQTGSVIKFGN